MEEIEKKHQELYYYYLKYYKKGFELIEKHYCGATLKVEIKEIKDRRRRINSKVFTKIRSLSGIFVYKEQITEGNPNKKTSCIDPVTKEIKCQRCKELYIGCEKSFSLYFYKKKEDLLPYSYGRMLLIEKVQCYTHMEECY